MRDGASSTVTKSADVYSFAIVCAEIAMKRAAWETEESGVDVDGTRCPDKDYMYY